MSTESADSYQERRRGRVVIGRHGRRLVAAAPRQSVVVFGPPGSGKTSSFAIPAVLEWDGPAIVCSVTSEIMSVTIPVRSSHDRMAWVYDPAATVANVIRIGWNPIPQCVNWPDATRLAHHLVSLSDMGSVQQGDFWKSAADSLLGPLLHAAAISHRSISDIMGWLAEPHAGAIAGDGGADPPPAFQTARSILLGATKHPGDDADLAEQSLRGATKGTPKDTMLSFVTTARVALKVFTTRAGLDSTRQQPNLDIDQLIDSDDTLYIIGTEDTQDELRPIFVGLIDAIIKHVGDRIQQNIRADKPLLLLLDEAANSAPLTKLPEYASALRSRDVQLVTIFQDYGQVVRRWGTESARTILSNHMGRVLLPGLADTTLLEDMSRLAGETHHIASTVSQGPGGTSISETQRRERLAALDELRTLPDGQALLIHANTRPAKIQLRPYYQQPQWAHLGGWLPNTHPQPVRRFTRRIGGR